MSAQNVAAPIPVVTINPSGKAPVPEPKVEAAPTQVLPKPPDQTDAEREKAQRFARLAREEKALNAKREQMKAERAAIDAEIAEARAVKERLAKAKTAPLEAMKALGLSYEELTNAQLADGRASPELLASSVRDEVAELKAQLAKEKADNAAASKAATEAENVKALADFRAEVAESVKADADGCELINLYGAHEMVSSLIEKTHAESGALLTIKDASAKVEEYLTAQAEKVRAAKKFQQTPKQATGSAQPRSITNDLTASTSESGARRPYNEKEAFDRALAALSR